ncbi:protein HEG homolog 1 isoform 2-T2 [Molossus nigricans]
MASPRASRWPPPLRLLLPLLLLPLAPGTRGQPSRAPLAGTGLARPPEPGPEHELQAPPPTPPRERRGPAPPGPNQTALAPDAAARPGPSGPGPRGGSAEASEFSPIHLLIVSTAVRNRWPESNTEPLTEMITVDQNQVDFSTMASKGGVMVQSPGRSHTLSDAPENSTPQTETAGAGGRNHSLRTNATATPAGPETAALASRSSTFVSGSTEELDNSTGPQSPSVSWTKSVQVAATSPSGAPGVVPSLTVSVGQPDETEDFSEDPETAPTSPAVRSPPSEPPEAGLRRSTGVSGSPGHGEFTEPSTENGLGLTPSEVSVGFWQNDSPTSEGRQRPGSSDTGNGLRLSQIEPVSGSVPSGRAGESTARWVMANSTMLEDGTGSSTSYPGVVNSSVVTQFAASVPQSRGSDTALGERSYSEPAAGSLSSSSSESVESSAPRGERSTTEDSPELGVRVDSQEGSDRTSGARAHSPHTSATVTGAGERTLRSVTNGSRASVDEGHSETAAPRETESATPRGNTTATGEAVGVTGIIYEQVSGTDAEQRTPSDHTDHTYVPSTFTKGERALLSITDNSSSSVDVRESSTSSVKIPDSSHSDSPSSSQVQTERSNVSSYGGVYAQPSTESPGLRTAALPSYTPTINMSSTLDLLFAHTGSAGGSSSTSGSPLPLPSVSQSHESISATLSSTRASARPPESTPDAPTPLSSSPPPLPIFLTVSTPASLPGSQTTLPPSSSTLVLPRARDTPGTAVRTSTMASSVTMLSSSQTADPEDQSNPPREKSVTESKPLSRESFSTEATEAETRSSTLGIPSPPALTEFSTEQTLPAISTSVAQTPPALTAPTLKTAPPPVPTPSPSPSTATRMAGPTAVQTTTGKQFLPTSPEILVPRISTEVTVTTKRSQMHVDDTTRLSTLTGVPTSATVLTTGLGISEEYSPTSHLLRTSPSPQSTDASLAEVPTPRSTTFRAQSSTQPPPASSPASSPASGNSCTPNPCLHDGKCVADPTGRGYRCVCSPSWQGADCSVDVNECLSNPCPPLAMCNNTQGSFTCRCPVGYQLDKGICNLVRTFVTEFKLKKTSLNTTTEKHSDPREIENEVTKTLNMCFSTIPGYTRSTAHASSESSTMVISLQTTFSLASNVTLFDLADGMQQCVNSCRSSAEVCQLLGSQRRIFRAGSLCKRKTPECDKETSICTDLDGVALCQCRSGYFQFNKMDHSCRACEDGYRLENETCMSCPFGLGGLNCGNPYQLITVVIAAAGGGLLLILGIALIVTCCRKNKNDISKLIFKSGDFQMSPYAEYPKNPRSQEWGREAIEMHENGSTKNLLQMSDVYYSPTSVRNPELERNGLYPAYTGLPGSRHSCIFPGQYNPSFISDESRRRDYF